MGYLVFYFRYVCRLLAFFDLWHESYKKVEWGLAGGHTGPRIVDVLGNWQPLGPVVLLEVAIDSEVLL
jgi:hypothetical protein